MIKGQPNQAVTTGDVKMKKYEGGSLSFEDKVRDKPQCDNVNSKVYLERYEMGKI